MTTQAPTRPKRTPIPPWQLAVPPDDDLTWFINHAESACGQRSALPALVGMIETGGQTRGRPSEVITFSRGDERDVDVEMSSADRRMLAKPLRREVSRDRALRSRWMKLGRGAQAVLVEAYGVRSFPHETKQPLGQLAGVALLTFAAGGGLPAVKGVRGAIAGHPTEAGRGEWLRQLCCKPGQNAEILDEMRREAGGMVRSALELWRLSRDYESLATDVLIFEAPPLTYEVGPGKGWAPDSKGRGSFLSPREMEQVQAFAAALESWAATFPCRVVAGAIGCSGVTYGGDACWAGETREVAA